MTEPRTLHEGGSGLGRDIHNSDTKPFELEPLTQALIELHRLKLALDAANAANERLSRSVQLRTLRMAIMFALGFLLCAGLLAVAR